MLDRSRAFSRFVAFGSVCAALLAISSCTGTYQSAGSPTSTVTMSAMTPSTVTLMTGQSQQFTVSVTGASNTSIKWSIFGSNSGGLGSINSSGLYTAPASVDKPDTVFTLYAGAAADTSVSRQAQITVNPAPPPVSVTITPSSETIQTGSTVQFHATVSAGNQSVTWGLQVNGQATTDPSYGTINATSGLYTAPNSVPNPANVTVLATSVQGPTATATVTIIAAGAKSISIDPNSVDILSGNCGTPGSTTCQIFTATVNGLQDQAVTWTATCSISNCGSVVLTGTDTATYTAPDVTSNLSVNLTATADADATLHAFSAITVVPPAPPALNVTCSNCSTTQPIAAAGTASLNAQVMNVPSGWTVTAINWASPANKFCISTDDPGDSDDPTPDNCSGDGDLDGPGTITVNVNGAQSSQATYKAPSTVWTGAGFSAVDVGCNQGMDTDLTKPWVFVPVEANLEDQNGGTQALQGFVCLRVGGSVY